MSEDQIEQVEREIAEIHKQALLGKLTNREVVDKVFEAWARVNDPVVNIVIRSMKPSVYAAVRASLKKQ